MSTPVEDIVTTLSKEISALSPGSRVDSEHTLMRRFGTTRAAVRSAIGRLETMYLVRRVQGAGTFVNRRIDYVISRTQAPSLHKTVAEGGGHCETILIGHDLEALPPAGRRRLTAGEQDVQHLTRLSHINDLPAVYLEEWVLDGVCEHVDVAVNAVRSVDETLRGMGHSPVRAWCRASLEVPPAYARERLELDDHQQTWVVESAIRDRHHNTPLFYSRAWTRQESIRIVLELDSDPSL